MGFKMKGSAFKLGNIATKSALKQGKSPMKDAQKGAERRHKAYHHKHPHSGTKDVEFPDGNFGPQAGTWTSETDFVARKGEKEYPKKGKHDIYREEEMESGPQMKSPMKDKQPKVKGHNRPGEQEVMHNIAKHPAKNPFPGSRKKKKKKS